MTSVPYATNQRLDTDSLEEKYGLITLDKARLVHTTEFREVFLVDPTGTTREYAITYFPPEMDPELAPLDAQIRDGGLIGKVFREAGYEIRKNVVDVYAMDLPEQLRQAFDDQGRQGKARLTEFYAKEQSGRPVMYGVILEVHTPDFQAAEPTAEDLAQVTGLSEALEAAGLSREEIWERMGTGDWSDVKDQVLQAREMSQARLAELKQDIMEKIVRERAVETEGGMRFR